MGFRYLTLFQVNKMALEVIVINFYFSYPNQGKEGNEFDQNLKGFHVP